MKKVLSLSVLALLAACSLQEQPALTESASLQSVPTASPVALVSANTYASYYHGMGSSYRSFSIQVKNLAYAKQVAILHQMSDGSWQEYPAVFSRTIDNNYELWSLSLANSANIWGDAFVVKYTVNGVTYWDNNNGQNYSMGILDGTWLNPAVNLQVNYRSLYYNSYTNQTTLSGSVDIRNLAYNKKVDIIYTTDNWQTTRVASARYVGPLYQVGYSQFINSPNKHGIERWTFLEYLGNASQVEFAVSYTVGGQTYWDNNHGANYRLSLNQ